MRPTVSVVIPYKDRPAQLRRALDSVCAQTLLPDEVIVVDDGSRIPLVLEEAFAVPVRVIRQENLGPAAARNRGIQEATGLWIALLDSDDAWFRDKLETQLNLISEHADAGFCVCDNRTRGRQPIDFPFAPANGSTEGVIPDAFERLLPGRYIHTSGVMFRKEVFESVGGFDERLWYCEDRDLWLRLAAATTVVATTRCLSEYFREGESLSQHEDTALEAETGVYILHKVLGNHLVDERLKQQASLLMGENLYSLAYRYRKQGQPFKACRNSIRSIRKGGPLIPNLKNLLCCWPESLLNIPGLFNGRAEAVKSPEWIRALPK